MDGFDFFDTGGWSEAEAAPAPLAAPSPLPTPTGNPILDRPARPAAVAKCSPTVADQPEQPSGAELAETRHSLGNPAESVATVATVAECQAGVLRLASLPRLPGLSERRWKQIIADAESFERVWLDRAVELGWTIQEMFGCYRNPLARRLDHEGLVHLLNGRTIAAIEATGAKIVADRRGTILTYYRHFDRSAAVPLWIAYSGVHQ